MGEDVLLEREEELTVIAAALGAACAGDGRLLVLEGAPGIGKTELLTRATELAAERSMLVLAGRGSELEREFAYGVVRQLLERELTRRPALERDELLAGAARHAQIALEVGSTAAMAPSGGARPGDPTFAAMHGLYWLCANLAAETPVLLAVDDVHWADPPSLRWLTYLAGRITGLPIALVITSRPPDGQPAHEFLARLALASPVGPLSPAPLSRAAVGQLIAAGLGEPDEAFVGAVHDLSGGTPFLVSELVGELRAAGITPAVGSIDALRELVPGKVVRSLLVRLGRHPPSVTELARSVAIFGDGTDLCTAASLAALDPGAAGQAADVLAAAGVLRPGRPLGFVHPLIRSAVYADLPPSDRAHRHAVAARLLAGQKATSERVAMQLLASEPAGDPWTVERLGLAATAALEGGAPEVAAACLRRAVAEPPSPRMRAHLLLELGIAESRAGEPSAVAHLEQALEAASDANVRAEATVTLGRTLARAGQSPVAVESYERACALLASQDPYLALKLEAALIGTAQIHAATAPCVADRIALLRDRVMDGREVPPGVHAVLAMQATLGGEPADRIAELAEMSTDSGQYLPDSSDPPIFYHACFSFLCAERWESVNALCSESIAEAERVGSGPQFAAASCFRAWAKLRQGRLAEAEVDARAALGDGLLDTQRLFVPLARAVLIETAIETGRAESTLDGRRGDPQAHTVLSVLLLAARGRLHTAAGRPREALADLAACAQGLAQLGAVSPAVVPWRSDAALAHLQLGELEEARRLAAAELGLTRALGAPRARA